MNLSRASFLMLILFCDLATARPLFKADIRCQSPIPGSMAKIFTRTFEEVNQKSAERVANQILLDTPFKNKQCRVAYVAPVKS